MVSSFHARIERRPDGSYLEDLLKARMARVWMGFGRRPGVIEGWMHAKVCNYRFLFQDAARVVPVEEEEPTILGVLDVDSDDHVSWATSPGGELRGVLKIGAVPGWGGERATGPGPGVDTLLTILPQAERAFVLLVDELGEISEEAISLRAQIMRGQPVYFRTIIKRVMKDGQAILSEDINRDDRFPNDGSVYQSAIRTMMCAAPLRDRDRECLGLIQVDSSKKKGKFEPAGSRIIDGGRESDRRVSGEHADA